MTEPEKPLDLNSSLRKEEQLEDAIDESVHGDDCDSTGGEGQRDSRKEQEEAERRALLNRKEQKGVQYLRILVYLVVIVTAMVVSLGAYYYAKSQEQDDFEEAFEINANKLAQAFLDAVDRKIVAVGGLSTSITHYAITQGLTFPFVTIENWETLSVQTRVQADGMVIEWCPLVTDENRADWEEYAYNNKGWVHSAFAREEAFKAIQDNYFGLEAKEIELPKPPPGVPAVLTEGQALPEGLPEGPPPDGLPPQGTIPDGQSQGLPNGQGEGPPTVDQSQSLQGAPPDGQSPPPEGEIPPFEPGQTPPQGTLEAPNNQPQPEGQAWPPGRGRALQGPPVSGLPTYTREIFIPSPVPEGSGPAKTIPRPLGSGPFAPRWQTSPVIPHEFLLNIDLMSMPDSKDAFQQVLQSHKAVLSAAEAVVDPNNITLEDDLLMQVNGDYLQRGQFRHDQKEFYNGDPITGVTYPVFDTFGPNRTIAGFLQIPLLWRLSLQKVLPRGFNGVIAVFKNNFNQSFSYRIDGPDVEYLGLKDAHDEKYDSLFYSQNVAEFIQAKQGPETQTYSSVELDIDFGQYDLYVYPSQALEDEYITNKPAIYATIVASIFMFTLLVLIAFDFLVARRQKVMMKKAVASTALVSTLFPEQVRDRLFEDGSKRGTSRTSNWSTQQSSLTHSTPNAATEPKAIAERYPAASVLLMDLAGFTEWSSSREPEEVFKLLETIYQSFDSMAKRRGVYKIETIGDCWVGVTGVPTAQDDHAPRIVKFASACQMRLQQLLVNRLAEQLGVDTKKLSLRVGVHSGPVTGGILRGDRGRFQLFGDTINTASRMESNGTPGKIHISQACADEMIRHGHRSWLVEREEKVLAKGKGEMTTYFVHVPSARTTASISVGETSSTETSGDDPAHTLHTDPDKHDHDRNAGSKLQLLHPVAETSEDISHSSMQYDAQVDV